jgi:RNA polymerase sigma-70 factor (ECF subfamily)
LILKLPFFTIEGLSNLQMNSRQTDPAQWVDEHGAYLYNYAVAQVRDAHAAEDLVQETFLAGMGSVAGFEGRSSVRTWLTGILKHKIIDALRKKYREGQDAPLPYEEEGLFRQEGEFRDHWRREVAPGDEFVDPGEEFDRREFWKTLDACLDRLPGRLKIAFTLREISDLATEEICKDLGVTTTNLWVMLHRARMQVRRCLEVKWKQ